MAKKWVQLELDLDDRPSPWGGRSPRGLTKGAKVLFSRREPSKVIEDSSDEKGDSLCRE